jgi:hypothetical protein
MKQITKLILLALLIVVASCQSESAQEDAPEQAILRFKDGNVVSDGELDKELMFNEESEILRSSKDSFDAKTNSCTPDLLDTGLNSSVNVEVVSKPGTNGYFDISLDGGDVIQAYCADRLPSLGADDDFLDFAVVSTYDSSLQDGGEYGNVFTNKEEFDKVNWILNNIDISEGSEYTYGHVQYAIWRLIEGPFVNDFTDFLTPNPGEWRPATDDAKGEAIFNMAEANGDGYEPGCGDLLGLVLIPSNPDVVQSLLIAQEIPAEEECSDCEGKVTDLTLNWDWHNSYRVRVYQRYENTWHAVKIFDQVVGPNENFDLSGVNHDGTFGRKLYIFVGHCYYTRINTNCYVNIGPGYRRGVIEVVSGQSSLGGELCEYEPPHNWCWWW